MIEEGKRIPKTREGQDPDTHSDLYTDENPKGTIKGLGFKNKATAVASVNKIKNSGKKHAHKIQAAIAMEQRARVAKKTEAAAVYRRYIEQMKKKTKQRLEEVYKDSGLGKWFGKGGKGGVGKGGWDRYNTKGERIGKCGDSKPGEGKPKCLSAEKAAKLRRQGGKAAIAAAVRRKKRKDPQQDRPGTGNKPINVSNKIKKKKKRKKKLKESFMDNQHFLVEKNIPTNPSLWSRAKALARKKFDVYPSAYANAWASKWYKKRGGGWKKGKKKTNEHLDNLRDMIVERRQHRLDEATKSVKAPDGFHWMKHGDNKYKLMKHEGEFKPHKDGSLKAEFDIQKLHEGVQSLFEKKSAAWTRKEGQNKEGGLNEKGRKAYERENPGSDLKAPVSKEQAKKSKGGKAAKRRKSFCARMGGMKRDHNIDCSKDPDKRICKALRKWDC